MKAKEPRLVSEKAGIERVSRALGAHRRARAVLHVDTADGCGGLVRAFASANRATWIRARAEWDGLAVFSAARPLASGLCVHSIHAASMRIAIQLGNRKTDKFRAGSLRKVIRLRVDGETKSLPSVRREAATAREIACGQGRQTS